MIDVVAVEQKLRADECDRVARALRKLVVADSNGMARCAFEEAAHYVELRAVLRRENIDPDSPARPMEARLASSEREGRHMK